MFVLTFGGLQFLKTDNITLWLCICPIIRSEQITFFSMLLTVARRSVGSDSSKQLGLAVSPDHLISLGRSQPRVFAFSSPDRKTHFLIFIREVFAFSSPDVKKRVFFYFLYPIVDNCGLTFYAT